MERGRERGSVEERDSSWIGQRKFSLFARRLRPSPPSFSFDESFPPPRETFSQDERSTLRNRRFSWKDRPLHRPSFSLSVSSPLARYLLLQCYTGNGIVIESYIDNLSTIRFLPFQDYILIAMACSKIIENTSSIDCLIMEIVLKVSLSGILSKVSSNFARISNTRILSFFFSWVIKSFSSRIIDQGNIMASY